MHENRLAQETSPYLLQHAHNPVDWYPWGEEAFEKARREGKPIFLSVGYSTCHWCHVMEKESFEDEEVGAYLNQHFVSIKVDREERPDVDDLYMTAVQMMTGRGGWPMSVWLTPDLDPFFGATYFPKQQFLQVLARITQSWQDNRGAIDSQAKRVAAAIAEQSQAAASAQSLSAEPVERSVGEIARRFDGERGGFGGAPKFPSETTILFLLGRYERTGDAGALTMARVSLDHMARGGIYDHVGGGFHRYSVDNEWLVPHFEKMLYNQAWLGRCYLEAFRLTGEPLYERATRQTLDYVLRDMTSPEGAFYTAEDADSEGEEGVFYVWRPAEILEILGPKDGERFNRFYGVTAEGNFEHGTTILSIGAPLEEFAAAGGTEPEALEKSLAAMRARLLEVRAKRPRPLRDDKSIAGWNGMMIGTFARAGAGLDEPSYARAADRAADFVLKALRDEKGELLRVHRAGKSKIPAFQDDYAYLIDGLLEIYRATGDEKRLGQARALADTMLERFWDEESGGFFSTGSSHQQLLVRSKDSYDGAVPSGNGVAAHDLARLARYTGEPRYREHAERTLGVFAEPITRMPMGYTYLLKAADSLQNGEPGPRADDPHGVVTAVVDPGSAAIAPGGGVAVAAEGIGVVAALEDIQYPEGEEIRVAFADEPLAVYSGEVKIAARLVLEAGAEAGPRVARVNVRYQACNDKKCLAPTTLPLELALRVEPPVKPSGSGGD